MTFGTVLREARKKRALTLRELARRARISPAYLSDIELGRRLPAYAIVKANQRRK